MYGRPEDIEGQCNAHLYIADDWGDNESTMRCQLPQGHEGPHQESYKNKHGDQTQEVTVTWTVDEKAIRKAWEDQSKKEKEDGS